MLLIRFKKTISMILTIAIFASFMLQDNFAPRVEAAAPDGGSGGEPTPSEIEAMPQMGGVSSSGSFQYSIPIELPPGTDLMQPKLSLNYDSNIRDGLLGQGWTISGLDAINRDPSYEINFDDRDHYLYNGQRLIQKADGTYRTQRDVHWIFELVNPNSDSSYWKVSQPDGTKVYYGYNSIYHQGTGEDGHIDAAGKDGKALLWSKSLVQNARGNGYVVKYAEAGAPYFDYAPSEIVYTVGNDLNMFKTIEFQTEARDDAYMKYVPTPMEMSKRITAITVKVNGRQMSSYRLKYAYGGQASVSLLTSVQLFGSDNVTAMSPYTFTYDGGAVSATRLAPGSPEKDDPYQDALAAKTKGGAAIIPGDFNGDGRIDFIRQEYGKTEGDSAFPIIQIYFATDQTAVDGSYRIVSPRLLKDRNDLKASEALIIPGDFNGDGKTDFLQQRDEIDGVINFRVFIAIDETGVDGSFNERRPMGDEYQHDLRANQGAFIIPGDFNGDGRTDFIRQEHGDWDDNDANTFQVYFATDQTAEDGTFHIVEPQGDDYQIKLKYDPGAAIIPGDFNGDGRMDFIRQERGKWTKDDNHTFQIYFAADQTPIDGTFHIVEPSDREYQRYLRSDLGANIIPGDFNGDGKMDFISQEHGDWAKDEVDTFQVYFATDQTSVDGTFRMVTPAGEQYQKYLNYDKGALIMPADFNGDGLTDFFRQERKGWDDDDKNSFNIYISLGDGTFRQDNLFPGTHFMGADGADGESGSLLILVDVNGDGKSDILRQEQGNWANDNYDSNFEVITTDYTAPKLMKVTNSMGGSATIAYSTAADAPGAIVPSEKKEGTITNTMSREVVTEIDYDDGYGEAYSYQYEYRDGKIIPGVPKDAVDLGYGSVKVTAPNGSYVITYYLQDAIYHGLVDKTVSFVLNKDTGSPVKVLKVQNAWGHSSAEGIDQLYLNEKTNDTYSANGHEDIYSETYQYDLYGNVTQVKNTRLEYDPYGKLREVKNTAQDPLKNPAYTLETAYLYNTEDYIVSFPYMITKSGYTPEGAWQALDQSLFLYDGQEEGAPPLQGTVTESRKRDGDSWATLWTKTYDAFGNTLSMTDANGQRTTTVYNAKYHDLPISVTNALNQTEKTSYDLLRRPVKKIDANGLTTTITYDPLSRVMTETVPPADNLYETITYSMSGRSVQMVYGDDNRTRILKYMDGFGRVIQTKTQKGENRFQTLDTYYHVDEETHVISMKTSIPYETNTMLFTTRDASRPMTSQETYADSRGGVMRLTDYDGKTSTVIQDGLLVKTMNYGSNAINKIAYYDFAGNIIKVEQYDGEDAVAKGKPYSWMRYAYYSGTGQLGKITDQEGNETSAEYDQLGRQTSFRDGDRGSWTYHYDSAGNLISATDAKGQTIRMSYDALNRVKQINDGDDANTVVYTYDEVQPGSTNIGRLTTVTYGSGMDRFQYGANGQLALFQRTIDGLTRALRYSYDVTGRTQSVVYPDGEAVKHEYSYQNLSSITRNGASLSSFGYTDYGAVSELRYGNGTTVNLSFDDSPAEGYSYLLNNLSVSGGDVDLDLSYGFDGGNNLTSIDDRSEDNADKTMLYDPLNRLIQESYPDGTSDQFSYNALDNLTQKNGQAMSYEGKQTHALTNDGDYAYTYDANGNMTSRIPLTVDPTIVSAVYGDFTVGMTVYGEQSTTSTLYGVQPVASSVYGAGIRTFSYNADNQLLQVSENGTAIFSAAYDYTGQRVKKTEGTRTTYSFFPQYDEVYEGSTLLETNSYYYDGSNTPFAWKQNGDLYYLFRDHLGSVVRVADSSGHAVGKSGYGPYGNTTLAEGKLPPQRYTGQVYDESTGLYYFNARYYDSNLAAFITADSIMPGGDTNGYAYAARSPEMYTDPSGHFIVALIVGVGAILTATGVGLYVAGTVTDNKGMQVAGLITAGVGLALMGAALPSALPAEGFMAAESIGGSMAINMVFTPAFGMVTNGISGAAGSDEALEWKRVLIDFSIDAAEGALIGAVFSKEVLSAITPAFVRDSWAGRNLLFKTSKKDIWITDTRAQADLMLPGTGAAGIEFQVKSTAYITSAKFYEFPALVFGAGVKAPIAGAKYAAGQAAGVRDDGFAYGAKLAVQPVNVLARAGGAKLFGKFGEYGAKNFYGMSAAASKSTGIIYNKIADSLTKSWALPKNERLQIYDFG
ncbi:RHS repeat-associated core domain-containing protein [Paenibacillus sp. HB172176]|uniref:RHS repeat-associated core domain-containing protein n=1 Tax=Paenibacillus sp. HB172176 TaxID=2493690 RepID=UPI00143A54DE|nr:RHS repeat-associated core domain-containing protein [Paenibacillus sp. HB172176]